MKAVVLAGGKGTRLAPYTKILPKPLMPIGDMPILEILLRQMKRSGIDEAILTVGHLAEILRAFFQDGSQFGLKLSYSYECQPLGTAGPLSLLDGLDDTFLVANGDVLTTLDLRSLVEYHRQNNAMLTIASYIRNARIDFGVIRTNLNNEIIGYIEKPSYDLCVSMGVYVFEPRVLSYIAYNQYLDFPDLVLKLLAAGERVMTFPYEGYWKDLGRIDDYEQAVKEIEEILPQILGEEFCEERMLAQAPSEVNIRK